MKNSFYLLIALQLGSAPGISCTDNKNSNFLDALVDFAVYVCFGNPQQCHKVNTQRYPAQNNNHTTNNDLRTDSWMQNYVYNQYAQIQQQFPGFDVMKNTHFVIESLRRDYRHSRQGNGEYIYTKESIDLAIGSNILNYMQKYAQTRCESECGLLNSQCKLAADRIFFKTHTLLVEKKVVDPSHLINVFSTEMNQEFAQLLDQQPKQTSHNYHHSSSPYNPEYTQEQEQLDRDTQRAIDESRKELERKQQEEGLQYWKQQQLNQQSHFNNSAYNPEWAAQQQAEEQFDRDTQQALENSKNDLDKGKEELSSTIDESEEHVTKQILSCGHFICPQCWQDQVTSKGSRICPRGNTHVDNCGKNAKGTTFKGDNATECPICFNTFKQ